MHNLIQKASIRLLLLLTFLVFISACSGTPSEGTIKAELSKYLNNGFGETIISVDNFRKNNGFEENDKTYIADISYDMVFDKSLEDIAGILENLSGQSETQKMGAGLGIMGLAMAYGQFQAGHTIQKEQKLTLVKTEQGWKVKK